MIVEESNALRNSNVVVVGGAGAIGINLIYKLLELNVNSILVIDNLSSSHINFLPRNKKIVFSNTDIFRNDELKMCFKNFDADYVIHLAAHFANQNSVDHPYSDIQTNIIGTVNLLEFFREKKIKKFVYASSSCVYGNVESMREDEYVYPYETPYSINKYTSEIYVKYYSHLFQVPAISLRFFNTYGPYEVAGKYRNVIPKFINLALRNEDINITGNGNETRDFTYITDTIDLIIKAAQSNIVDGSVYNGGTGIETEIKKLAELIIEISDSNSKIVFSERRNWDSILKRVSIIEKSSKILDYYPKTNIYNGLKKTIDWYRNYLSH